VIPVRITRLEIWWIWAGIAALIRWALSPPGPESLVWVCSSRESACGAGAAGLSWVPLWRRIVGNTDELAKRGQATEECRAHVGGLVHREVGA
jgi:hypothetical protein